MPASAMWSLDFRDVIRSISVIKENYHFCRETCEYTHTLITNKPKISANSKSARDSQERWDTADAWRLHREWRGSKVSVFRAFQIPELRIRDCEPVITTYTEQESMALTP